MSEQPTPHYCSDGSDCNHAAATSDGMTCHTCSNEADLDSNEYGFCTSCWNIGTARLLKAVTGDRCQTCNTRRVDRNGQQCWACLILDAGKATGMFVATQHPGYGLILEAYQVQRRLKEAGVVRVGRAFWVGGRGPYTDWPDENVTSS